jgi:multidrug efflux pump subunit AcrA (membrane-fusion protein)
VPVEVVFERDGMTVIRGGGLKAGDEVIVEGNERLFPGTPLEPRPWSEERSKVPAKETAGSR